MEKTAGLSVGSTIAEIGSGTGILTGELLRRGFAVYAVEPNREMRQIAEAGLSPFPGFTSVDGTAEDTTLPAHSVDAIVAAQAFHWFEPVKTRKEFLRILKPGGPVVLIWNEQVTTGDSWHEALEKFIIRHATDYTTIYHKNLSIKTIQSFFGSQNITSVALENMQTLNWQGLSGRLASCSFMPEKSTQAYDEWQKALKSLFNKFEKNGHVTIKYKTIAFCGKIQGN